MGIYTRTQEASKTQSLAAVESRSLTCKIKYPYSSVALAPFSSTFTPAGYWVLRTAGSSSKQMRAASRRAAGGSLATTSSERIVLEHELSRVFEGVDPDAVLLHVDVDVRHWNAVQSHAQDHSVVALQLLVPTQLDRKLRRLRRRSHLVRPALPTSSTAAATAPPRLEERRGCTHRVPTAGRPRSSSSSGGGRKPERRRMRNVPAGAPTVAGG